MQQYHDLLRHILDNGVEKTDRTGTGTRSIFGPQMRFDLSEGFPLVTTKKVHLKSIIHELLWLLKGDTNIKYLVDNGVRIWNEWADANGELGPVYGQQLRAWSNYQPKKVQVDCGNGGEMEVTVHENHPIDQLQQMVDLLKSTPDSRRMVVSTWNVAELPQMKLSPCHCLFQFDTAPLTRAQRWAYYLDHYPTRPGELNYIADKNVLDAGFDTVGVPQYRLDCQLYQRSADLFLGVPFNIASYALLTMMLAQVVNMVPGEFIWTGGNTHIYNSHLEQVKLQLSRELRPLPTMKLNPEVQDLFGFKYEYFTLEGYDPWPAIKAPVAV